MSASFHQKWTRPARLIPLCLLVLVALGIMGLKLSSRSTLERELAAIRAKDLPTNPLELDRWYTHVPANSNAALKIIEARQHLVYPPEKANPDMFGLSNTPHDQPLDAHLKQIAEEHVARNKETLTLLHEAARLPLSRYPAEIHKAPKFNMTHLSPVKSSAQLLRWEAIIAAEREDSATASAALQAGFALSHTLAHEPLLISELVRMACLAIQLAGMERVVTAAEFNDAQLTDLVAAIKSAESACRPALQRALIGERAFANTGRVMSFDEYNIAAAFGGATFPDEWPKFANRSLYQLRIALGVYDRDIAFYFKGLGRLIDATTPENPNFIRDFDSVAAELTTALAERPYAYLFSNLALPSMLRVAPKEAHLIARLRCAEMALQIGRFRLRSNGRLPRGDELVPSSFPELPRDPFDNSPLQYESLPKGFRITATAATAYDRRTRTNAPAVAFTVLR